MLIVSDNSPLNLLIRLGLSEILPSLFQKVIIPTAVLAEMQHPRAPGAVRLFAAVPPLWLEVRTPRTPLALPEPGPGESAAISLAVELGAELMVDEFAGPRAAIARGVQVIGAIGVLERAADAGLIPDLARVHHQINALGFHVAPLILEASPERHVRNTAKLRPRGRPDDAGGG